MAFCSAACPSIMCLTARGFLLRIGWNSMSISALLYRLAYKLRKYSSAAESVPVTSGL
jgi:hypothetical protein